ncbi:MAG: hypothetical protein ACRDD9_21620 [Shewanella sp.]
MKRRSPNPSFEQYGRVKGRRLLRLTTEELKVFDNPTLLLWSLAFGLFGLGFFTYGKRQAAPIPLAVGLTLMIYPYFVTNLALLIAIGIALIALPYFVRI